tara:strand:- start:16 stop:876 length:861 start_codon:yes stop_codon:yes gene_type:complete
MPIIPFTDRPRVDLNVSYYSPTVITGSAAAGNIDQYKQGVSVRTTSQAMKKLTPLLSSTGFPNNIRSPIDHSIDQTTYGFLQFFTDTDNDIDISPYDDIATLRDPVKFLQDEGITAYPQVMLSPNWMDPGMMNGIIEPLTVRGTLPGASIDSPFVAHTIRAALMISPVQYERYQDSVGEGFNIIVPFIDSQDIAMRGEDLNLAGDPIGDFGTNPVEPFCEHATVVSNDLKEMSQSLFNDFVGVGIISNKVSTTFGYDSGKSGVARGKTGIRNVTVIDSIAFGGLMR